MISEKQAEILRHMLGADDRYLKKEWGFRNYYVAIFGDSCHNELLEMQNLRMVSSQIILGNPVFRATKLGALEIGFKLYQLKNAGLAK